MPIDAAFVYTQRHRFKSVAARSFALIQSKRRSCVTLPGMVMCMVFQLTSVPSSRLMGDRYLDSWE